MDASLGAFVFTTALSFLIVSTAFFVRVSIFIFVEDFVCCMTARSFFNTGSSFGLSRMALTSFGTTADCIGCTANTFTCFREDLPIPVVSENISLISVQFMYTTALIPASAHKASITRPKMYLFFIIIY
ncbi:hypothetical protein AR158_C677R [Paramecium bursaria Chlorella virus AR158]|uniref:hypothetical protein n=1 Tax=Paramecium bursaria Chlorella virus AR158 TaxID=380598 RepID=UPI00015AA838|nr:hypothetical protein AR158_C677R [Paramecium bursaria Chlorella virus AR158]ABU44222.1 hypothetical protein AR158_C677R [Paramecium bursaria Chlorella virus AR158]